MIRVLTFQSPRFFVQKGQVQSEFEYHGAFLDICFERIIRELGIVKDEDEYITITYPPRSLQQGDVVECDLLIEDKTLEFIVINTRYDQ